MIKDFFTTYAITEEEPLIVACSGGADSMYLLSVLLSAKKKESCIVAHFDHSLRGAESDADRAFVIQYCHEKGLICEVQKKDIKAIAKEKKIGLEEAARIERYEFLREIKEKYHARFICTGHHLDDRIETMMFNLIRGTKLSGLTSLKEKNDDILRPLLSVSKKEILTRCNDLSLPFRTDSSNTDTTFQRNKIRLDILSEFEAINPEYRRSLQNFMEYTDEVLSHINNDIHTFLGEQDDFFEVEKFKASTPFLQKEIIRFLYEKANAGTIGLSMGNIQEIIRFIGDKGNYTKKEVQNLKLEKINGKVFIRK